MIMVKALQLLTVSLVLLLCVPGCRSEGDYSGQSDLWEDVSSLVGEATQDLANQDFESAMEKALSALEISRSGSGFPKGEVQALYTIIGIDIMSSRDADAWEKAIEAEAIARKYGFNKELSQILIAKENMPFFCVTANSGLSSTS